MLTKKENEMMETIRNIGFEFFWNYIPTVWGEKTESQVFRYYVVMTYRNKKVLESKYTIGKGFADKNDGTPNATALHCIWGKFPTFNPVGFLHSIYSDSQAFGETFDNWCSNYGYDTDSREAKKIYKKCHSIGKKLLQATNRETLNLLDILFEDY